MVSNVPRTKTDVTGDLQQRAVAELLRDLLKICPQCNRILDAHTYAMLATLIVPKRRNDTLEAFFQAIKNRDWERLQEFQTWDPRADDLEAYAITCIGHPAFTAVIKTHFELFQGSRLMLCEGLTDTESLALRRVFSTVKWNSF